MSMIHQIKVLQSHDYSVCAIGAQLGCDRKTVRKYLQQRVFSPPPVPVKRERELFT